MTPDEWVENFKRVVVDPIIASAVAAERERCTRVAANAFNEIADFRDPDHRSFKYAMIALEEIKGGEAPGSRSVSEIITSMEERLVAVERERCAGILEALVAVNLKAHDEQAAAELELARMRIVNPGGHQ